MKHLSFLAMLCMVSMPFGFCFAQVQEEITLRKILIDNGVDYGVQGISSAVILEDETLITASFGIGKSGALMTDSTLFLMGSLTEMYVAALALKLEEAGMLDIDNPVSRYMRLPACVAPGVTVRQLLTHTSGIANIFLSPEFDKVLNNSVLAPEQILWQLLRQPNAGDPGTVFQLYNPTDYLILGLLIERITGNLLAKTLRKELWEKLNLSHTFFGGDEKTTLPFAGSWQVSGRKIENLTDQFPTDAYLRVGWGSNNLISTPADACKFVRALVDGRLLSKDSFAKISTPVPQQAIGYQIGMSLELMVTDQGIAFGSAGGRYYFLNNGVLVFHHPGKKITIGLATNTTRNNPVTEGMDVLFKAYEDIYNYFSQGYHTRLQVSQYANKKKF